MTGAPPEPVVDLEACGKAVHDYLMANDDTGIIDPDKLAKAVLTAAGLKVGE